MERLTFLRLTNESQNGIFQPVSTRKKKKNSIRDVVNSIDIEQTLRDKKILFDSYQFEDPTGKDPAELKPFNKLLRKYKINTSERINTEEMQMTRLFEASKNNFYENKKTKIMISTEESFYDKPKKIVQSLRHNEAVTNLISSVNSRCHTDRVTKLSEDYEKQQRIAFMMPEVTILPIPKVKQLEENRDNFTGNFRLPVKGVNNKRKLFTESASFRVYKMKSGVLQPVARTKCIVIEEGHKLNLLYGLAGRILDDTWEADLYDHDTRGTIKWKKTKVKTFKFFPVYGCTAVKFSNQVFIYGGATFEGVTDNIYTFDIRNKSIMIKNPEKSLEQLKRKYHIAVTVGIDMLVHGGIDENGKVISTAYYFDMVMGRWARIYFKNDNFPLSEHAACVVNSVKKNPKNMNLFNLQSFFTNVHIYKRKAANDGIYLFGGVDNKKRMSDRLLRIIIGDYPLYWEEVETQGLCPEARRAASLTFSESLGSLVLIGGLTEYAQEYMDELWLFYLENGSWLRVPTTGTLMRTCGGHSTVPYGDKLLVFGGMNEVCFCGNTVYCIDLSF